MGDPVPPTEMRKGAGTRGMRVSQSRGTPSGRINWPWTAREAAKKDPHQRGDGVLKRRESQGETEAVRGMQAETQLDTVPACPKDVREGGGLARVKENRIMPQRAVRAPG